MYRVRQNRKTLFLKGLSDRYGILCILLSGFKGLIKEASFISNKGDRASPFKTNCTVSFTYTVFGGRCYSKRPMFNSFIQMSS